jgi:hypothetical protein
MKWKREKTLLSYKSPSKTITALLLLIFVLVGAYSILQSKAATLTSDINKDGIVNTSDLSLLLSSYGHAGSACVTSSTLTCDLNGDAVINILDLSIMLSTYGQSSTIASSRIYWGGFLEGQQTYAFYYGNPAPDGQPWGNTPWASNTWNRFESNAGKKVSILSYGQPPPWAQTAVDTNAANISYSRGSIPYITMGKDGVDDLAAIAAGTYDTQIKTWATNIKTYNKPIFLRLWWEMNGGWYSWGNGKTPATTYITAWKHVHDVVAAQGAGNVTWVWCPNIIGGTVPDFTPWYPGDSYVDWTCLDGYNKNSTSMSFATLYDASYKKMLAIAPTKPIVIGEIESFEYASGVKAAWLKDVFQTQLPKNYPQIKAVLLFNWREFENGMYEPTTIESSASAQQAFHDSIQSSYYAAGGTFTLPTGLNKVKPLP